MTTRRRQRDRVRKGSRDEEWHRMYNNCNNTYLRFQAPPRAPLSLRPCASRRASLLNQRRAFRTD